MTPKIRLNQRAVDQLSAPDPGGKQKIHWDRGFGVRCSGKTNGKSYVVQHDLPNGRARRITVGSASVFAIAEAKQRAEKLLSLFYNGVGPMAADGSDSAVGRRDRTLKTQSFSATRQASANHLRRSALPRRRPMMRTLMIGTVSATALALSAAAFAQQGGTAQEARAMLDKAVAAVKADQAVALAMFIKGEGGFRDRELYPFCFRIADGKTLASPKAVPAGTDVRSLKDSTGKSYGEALYAAAQKPEGQITEVVSYLFPKPHTTAPTFEKVSFVTKVGDLGCGVGYYK